DAEKCSRTQSLTATATSASSPTLLFAPLQEFAEQGLAIGLALWRAGSDAIQEGLEIATDAFLSRYRRAMQTSEHLLGDDVPGPARDGGGQVDVAPFGMTGRDQELVPLGEEPLDKAFDATVSVATPRPVEHGKNRRHRDGIDFLPFRNERRIVLRLEL